MGTFANLTANVRANITDFAQKLKQVEGMATATSASIQGKLNSGLVEPAKKSKFEFKDVSRIVQGILISKAFYSGLNAIRNCSDAVWEFSQQLEYAKVAYSNLFGDTALAEEFINVLKDFAATTPFSFKESEAAAKRLLAYGIEYKNVMYVMQGVLAASSVQNNPHAIESVSRALGQIYTKGRLMNEEMRQLAEAGIPAYEILSEKLGLTQEQLQQLGREGIPASKAINALVDGMTERFGNVVDASTRTMSGIISNIVDNATIIASKAFEPIYTSIKSVTFAFGNFLSQMREVIELKGVGGLFEALFPPEMHGTIRQFIANILTLLQAVVRLVMALGSMLRPAIEAVLRLFNAFAPVIITIVNVLSTLTQALFNNTVLLKMFTAALATAATMWILYKVRMLAAVAASAALKLIAKALSGLETALTFVLVHPFWALLLTVAGLVVGLSGGFGKLSNAVSGFFKKLTSFNGVDPDKLLLPSQEERANDLNKFNEALDGTSDSMDDLADSTGKATKAAKGLLSFDEVFKLNEPDEGTDKGIDTDTDFEIPDLSGLGGAGFIPEIPDFTGFADNFVVKLTKALKERLLGAGIGAILGTALGSLLGGPLGAKIGAIAGAIAGWFWEDLAEALNLTDVGKVALPITTGLGAIIGAIIGGGPMGAAIGGAIGALAGWLIDSITRGIQDGDWSKVGYPLGISLGAAIGYLAGGPAGAAIGAGIGALVGWIADGISNGIQNGDWTGVVQPLAIGIGGAIGFIAGGPGGAVIGAAVGALVGWVTDLIVSNWDSITKWFSNVGHSIGQWITDTVESYNNWAQSVEDTVNTWADNTWKSFTNWVSNTATAIGNWITDTVDAYNTWASDTEDKINAWADKTWKSFTKWVSDTITAIGNWITDTVDAYNTWASDTEDRINTWADNTWNSFTSWVSDTIAAIGNWITDTTNKYNNWASTTENKINTWADNTWKSFIEWSSNVLGSIRDWASEAFKPFTDWVSKVKSIIGGWVSNVKTSFSNCLNNLKTTISNGLNNMYTSFKNWITKLWDNVFGKFFNWIDNGITKLKEFFKLDDKAKNTPTPTRDSGNSGKLSGHATGGVFNREHIARFAEGNKAEAIIPLENAGAMQPFVDAVANGITATLAPIIANVSGGQQQSLQPLYVGTLIADERSLKELERRMQVIRIQESKR